MSETEKPKESRLKESDWIVIISLWERGEATLRELSDKFGVSDAAISQGLKRRGIKRGSKAHLSYKEIESKMKEEREKLIEEIYNFKKRFIKYGDFLMSLTINEITEAKKSKTKLFTIKNEIDTLYSATKVYKTIRNDLFHLYDLNNPTTEQEENLDFNIGVYTNEDLEAERKRQALFDELAGAHNSDQDDEEEEISEHGEGEES